MATCTPPVRAIQPATRTPIRALLLVALAVGLPILSGLAWHRASDNPIWPLVRNTLNLCELREAPLSPLSPDGLYRVRIVQASCFGRFNETLVFVTGVTDPWQLSTVDPNRAVLEVAGLRSLDAINWRDNSHVLQLWFTRGASPYQIHRLERTSGAVTIRSNTSSPAPGAERLAY